MNKTLMDIHYLMAQVWLNLEDKGIDAYSDAKFTTLAEKYGFFCDNVDEAIKIMEQSS